MGAIKWMALQAIMVSLVHALPEKMEDRRKAIGIFNVVKFPNDGCVSGNQLGTCYTAEECSARDGTASGSCADGYGVCCIISISCGETSSENCTYITQDSTTSPNFNSEPTGTRACTYKICPRDTTIRRIRFDFTNFQIAAPIGIVGREAALFNGGPPVVVGMALQTSAATSIGNCNTDSFSITGTRGPYPTICGMNTGQHMFTDTDGSTCVTGSFSFGLESSSRSYSIHVTQYAEGDTMGGPSGCLQYYVGNEGVVRSFNWQGRADLVSSIHLANQRYDACIRGNVGSCRICWAETTTWVAAMGGGSFSVGLSTAAAAVKSGTDTDCATDYVEIPQGRNPATAAAVDDATIGIDRYCGRLFNFARNLNAVTTVCSAAKPFRLGVNFDATEITGVAGNNMENVNELSAAANEPLGTWGFELAFIQSACAN